MTIVPTGPPRRRVTRPCVGRMCLASQNARLRREVERLRHEATHDRLTGLLNRAGLAQVWPVPGGTGLLLLDLNRFKPVNDRYGHLAGDLVLIEVASRLSTLAPVVGRLGGDEFVLITTDPEPHRVARRVEMVVAAPITLPHGVTVAVAAPITLPHGVTVAVSAAVGVHQFSGPARWHEAIEAADRAMYTAKHPRPSTGTRSIPRLSPDVESV